MLAFPSNEFGEKELKDSAAIRAFAEGRGLLPNAPTSNFVLMRPARVNGHATHRVFQFLRAFGGDEDIEGNFATKWVVRCEGVRVCEIKRCDGANKLASKCLGRLQAEKGKLKNEL